MYEKQDAKNSHRDYGMEKKFGSGLRHNITLLWILYLDPLFCVMGALQLIRAARGNPTTAYINTLLRYTVLEILIVGLDTNIT